VKSLRLLAIVVGAAALIAGPGAALAQPYPNKPIRMVIAFPPGGTSDFVGRVVGAKLAKDTNLKLD
jgi:tripartite-type tricarboxylate transporter receptor subunit TctC